MKKLISINHKFFDVSENELVELSKNKIDGFEVYIICIYNFMEMSKKILMI